MVRIVRPVRGRVRVWLPYQRGSGNYDLLKELCGGRTRPDYNRALRCFEVAREHLPVLMDELARQLGRPVEITLQGASQTKCVDACYSASPDTVWQCVCSCAGVYHGTGVGPPKQLADGLAIATEYTEHTFIRYP